MGKHLAFTRGCFLLQSIYAQDINYPDINFDSLFDSTKSSPAGHTYSTAIILRNGHPGAYLYASPFSDVCAAHYCANHCSSYGGIDNTG